MVYKSIIDIQNNKFIINGDGNYGIDTTNPGAKFQIGNRTITEGVNDKPLFQVNDTLIVTGSTGNKRVGIGKYPEEDLDVDGNIRISSAGTQKITFYDNNHDHDHEHGKILFTNDGVDGSEFEIFTKVDNGSVTQKLTINNAGSIGIGSTPDYGQPGQFITSNGTSASVYWSAPSLDSDDIIEGTSNKYIGSLVAGTGITITGETISIGQEVAILGSFLVESIFICIVISRCNVKWRFTALKNLPQPIHNE